MSLIEKFKDAKAAEERIESSRKGNCTIQFESAEGPLEVVEVIVKQMSHDFIFGCNAFGWGKMETRSTFRSDWSRQELDHNFNPLDRVAGHGKDYGDGLHEDDVLYTARFRAIFNLAVLPFYELATELHENSVNLHRVGRMADWARKNQLRVKGHPLCFNEKRMRPQWLNEKTPEEYWEWLKRRVKQIFAHLGDQVDVWDFLNEAINNRFPEYPELFDSAKVMYQLTRELAPNAILTLNDCNCFGEHADTYVDVLQRLEKENLKPDVLGLQSHFWTMDDEKRHMLVEALDKYEAVDIPIHFTEATFVPAQGLGLEKWEAEANQARDVAEFYTYLFSRPQVKGIIWWDLCDRHSFCNVGGLLRDDMSMKPAYQTLDHLINHKWRTVEQLPVSNGLASFRGFYGEYEADIKLANGTRYYNTFHLDANSSEPIKFII